MLRRFTLSLLIGCKITIGAACLSLALLFAPVAAAQDQSDRFDCWAMRGLQCRPEARAELLALYGLPTAESRLAAGSEMYRVFIFDAWMRHHVAVTVERSPGSLPILTLSAPPRPSGSGGQTLHAMSAPISVENWYMIRRRATLFDRVMVPEPPSPAGDIRICMGHGPLYFVESTAPEADEERRLRRSGLPSCSSGGLAEPLGLEVALLAQEVLPACTMLNEDGFPRTANLLRACAILSGDGLAAAEVYNRMRPLLADAWEPSPAEQLERLFTGAEAFGPGSLKGVRPVQVWLRAVGTGDQRAEFIVEQVHGRGPAHVTVEGLLRRRIESDGGREGERVEEAPVQMEWMSDRSSDFEIRRLSMGEYARAPDLCNSRDPRRRAVDC